ncbi:tetratricopeptide repeat protein [Myxococcota bacterium]|nr:tetratricopeptide repeat protein [Myxococcota bacterium]
MAGELDRLLSEGREAYRLGDLTRAETLLSQAVKSGAERYADVHHTLGVVYHTWGQFSKARAAFEEALRINPGYTEAALNLSITYNDLGRYAEAREIYARVLPPPEERLDAFTRGKIANLHAQVGDAYRSSGLAKEAAIEYHRALGLCPGFIDIRMRLAHALADQGALAEAIEQVRLVLVDNARYVPAHLHLGLLLHRAGDDAGARKALTEVLRLEPGHERAAMYLRMLEPGKRSE